MRIGILGGAQDPHCVMLQDELRKRGFEGVVFDFSAQNGILPASMSHARLTFGGESIEDIRVFFLRSVMSPLPYVQIEEGVMKLYDDWHVQYMRARQKHGFVLSWLMALQAQGKMLVNPIPNAYIGQLKPFHTYSLLTAGIPVPPTIMTSEPQEALNFLRQYPLSVYKPVMGGAVARMVDESVIERLELIRECPIIFQQYIRGENIRVTLTDEKILSVCEIPSDAVDFRESTGYEAGQAQYASTTIPPDIEALCFRAIRASGYRFSAIDIVRAFPHDYYFLECNFAPAYADIERKTGHAITSGIVDYLLQLHHNGAEASLSSSDAPVDAPLFDFRLN